MHIFHPGRSRAVSMRAERWERCRGAMMSFGCSIDTCMMSVVEPYAALAAHHAISREGGDTSRMAAEAVRVQTAHPLPSHIAELLTELYAGGAIAPPGAPISERGLTQLQRDPLKASCALMLAFRPIAREHEAVDADKRLGRGMLFATNLSDRFDRHYAPGPCEAYDPERPACDMGRPPPPPPGPPPIPHCAPVHPSGRWAPPECGWGGPQGFYQTQHAPMNRAPPLDSGQLGMLLQAVQSGAVRR